MIKMSNPLYKKIWATMILIIVASLNCGEKPRILPPKDADAVVPRLEYSLDKPGEWVGLEAEHIPRVTINRQSKPYILVWVPLKNASTEHYIEKIGIMDKDRNDIALKVFSRHEKYFEAKFLLSEIKVDKDMKLFAKCNLHDLWVTNLKEALDKK